MKLRYALTVAILLLAGCSELTDTTTPVIPTPVVDPTTTSEPVSAENLPLEEIPVMPVVSARAAGIFADGQARGRDAHAFSRVGDCMTASENFLVPFSSGAYDLGDYGELQAVIDHFSSSTVDSFGNIGLAANSGCTTAGPLDPMWANPAFCEASESPLVCELRVTNAAFALIMFGTNDITFMDAGTFDGYMHQIVEETIALGVLPILSTFPPRPDAFDTGVDFNEVIARVAAEYDVPLVNLWRVLLDMPGYGVDLEHTNRLLVPEDGCAACFTSDHLTVGITQHNLVMLQALGEILTGLGALPLR